jgi:predicted ATPase with chaperone activity
MRAINPQSPHRTRVRCAGAIIQWYLGKISGPLFDRIDLFIEAPAEPHQELRSRGDGVFLAEMLERA